jgi:uncharacterized repeat protein (TIGR01451 family)
VTLTDTLPSGVTFVSATGGVTPASGVLTFPIGGLAAGASAMVTIVVTPTAAGALTDTAAVTMDQADPTPGDNSVTLPISVAAVATTADLALSAGAPDSVTLGENVTYTLMVTNGGPSGATGVSLTDTLPAGVTFVSTTGGVAPVGGVLTFALGNLAAGASTTVTIVVTPTTAGTLQDTAAVGAKETDPSPADNTVARTTTVAPAGGGGPTSTTVAPSTGAVAPIITSVHRFGFHLRPTTLVLTFDQTLDPARAQDLTNYHLVAMDGPRGTVRIRSAAYDPAARTVTLTPMHRLYLYHRYRLTVVGHGTRGLADTSGDLLDGQKAGHPGSDFVATISAADLALTPAERKDASLMQEIEALAVPHPGLAHLIPGTAARDGHGGGSDGGAGAGVRKGDGRQ